MIEGVNIKKLERHIDDRGFVMEMLRRDDDLYQRFGQAYVCVCNPGFVKAWHYHKKQTDHFAIVKGKGKVALFDMREDSDTSGKVVTFDMGDDNDILITIPPMVAHGIECREEEPCFLMNFPTEPYNKENPDEHRIPFDTDSIPYKWKAEKGG